MNYYILASQTGTGHAGTEGDPWTYDELVSNIASLASEDTILAQGYFYLEGKQVAAVPTDKVIYWNKWGDDPWRMYFNSTSLVSDFRGYIFHNGIMRIQRRLKLGLYVNSAAPNGDLHMTNMNFLMTTESISTETYQNIDYDGCNFFAIGPRLSATSLGSANVASKAEAIGKQITYRDCIVHSRIFTGNTSNGTITKTYNCALSSPYTETNVIYDANTVRGWQPQKAFPDWNSPKKAFSYLRNTVPTPPNPGKGSPTYTGYTTDPWGTARTGIGAFFLGAVADNWYMDLDQTAGYHEGSEADPLSYEQFQSPYFKTGMYPGETILVKGKKEVEYGPAQIAGNAGNNIQNYIIIDRWEEDTPWRIKITASPYEYNDLEGIVLRNGMLFNTNKTLKIGGPKITANHLSNRNCVIQNLDANGDLLINLKNSTTDVKDYHGCSFKSARKIIMDLPTSGGGGGRRSFHSCTFDCLEIAAPSGGGPEA